MLRQLVQQLDGWNRSPYRMPTPSAQMQVTAKSGL
jgi:hypothetical protein